MLFCSVAVHVKRRFSNGRPSMQAAVQGHLGRMNYVVIKMVDLVSESAALPANEQDSTRGAELRLQLAAIFSFQIPNTALRRMESASSLPV